MVDDFLADYRRPLLEPGEYIVAIVSGSTIPNKTLHTEACDFEVEVLEGPQAGARVRLRVRSNSSAKAQCFVERDMRALAQWSDVVGAAPATNLEGVIKNLWRASRGYRVRVKIGRQTDLKGVVEYFLIEVYAEPRVAGDQEQVAEDVEDEDFPF